MLVTQTFLRHNFPSDPAFPFWLEVEADPLFLYRDYNTLEFFGIDPVVIIQHIFRLLRTHTLRRCSLQLKPGPDDFQTMAPSTWESNSAANRVSTH